MKFLVLTTRPEENLYGDTALTYSFPTRYLASFEPLTRGEEITALLYEPRRGEGRTSYVGWATLDTPPFPDPVQPQWWMVRYADTVRPFPRIVPRVLGGRAFESWLNAVPVARHGPTLQGRSVRDLAIDDFLAIVDRAGLLPAATSKELQADAPFERRRVERVIARLARDGSFRERVLAAYDRRCALTGFGARDGRDPHGGVLVDAAHLRPVGDDHAGDDTTTNGIAFTPSVHRLFDEGLFTLHYTSAGLTVATSPALARLHLGTVGTGSALILTDGLPLRLPADERKWPSPSFVAYHAAQVFRS